MTSLAHELAVATAAATRVGEYFRSTAGQTEVTTYKAARDAQLAADLHAEQLLLEALRNAFPEDDILTEESGSFDIPSGRRWIIDPLDGSFNFQHGYPLCGTAIALQIEGETRLGVLTLPFLQETYTVVKGEGAWLNGTRLQASTTPLLAESLVQVSDFAVTGNPADNEQRLRIMQTLANTAGRVRMSGTAISDFAWLAAGRMDGMVMYSLHPWDIEAGKLLVEEAGGLVTRIPLNEREEAYVASNTHLHDGLLALVTSPLFS